MGVPKFFRWLSEGYPKILQRIHTGDSYKAQDASGKMDPLGQCGLMPPIDHLYIDVNGILHGCSHNGLSYSSEDATITNEQIVSNVATYLDRIICLTKPTSLIYLAIDGVAPRAKLNQQRSRRYRAGGGGDDESGSGELSVYEAYLQKHQSNADHTEHGQLHLVNGRLIGKVQEVTPDPPPLNTNVFHSNNITPGTEFFQDLMQLLQVHLIEKLLPKWRSVLSSEGQDGSKLQIILSGPNVPGEGEHKIMQFLREQRSRNLEHHSSLRHCIMGQDGDLILLGLATHDPNLLLLREKVRFSDEDQKRFVGPLSYLHNPCFELLHFGILRDYLALEFEAGSFSLANSEGGAADDDDEFNRSGKWDLERTIDDLIFLTFFVGNDFLPHLPAMDIGDEGLDFLFAAYCEERHNWLSKANGEDPYLTHSGRIVSFQRLEDFLGVLGSHEHLYHDYKKSTADMDKQREFEERFNRTLRTPSDDVLLAKEQDDRKRYREMIVTESSAQQLSPLFQDPDENSGSLVNASFDPVVSDAKALSLRMNSLLQLSVTGDNSSDSTADYHGIVDDQDIKGRYYFEKFGFTPFDAEKHLALRKAYLEGLIWTLHYYFRGCLSWEWFYPYHYGPMMSDLVGLEDTMSKIEFEPGAPLRPFEQLLACLPPSHAHILPPPFRPLFDDDSSIKDFYPRSFTVDMNGKRLPWEAVALLPFIDSKRLLDAVKLIDTSTLDERERDRNQFGQALVLSSKADHSLLASKGDLDNGTDSDSLTEVIPFEESVWFVRETDTDASPCFHPVLPESVPVPLPGLPTLRDGSIVGMWRSMVRINIHGSQSRYNTTCLELKDATPEIIPTETLASQLIGSIVYINYPHLLEAFVTAVSDDRVLVRGMNPPRPWTPQESITRKARATGIFARYVFGEGLVGTGGLALSKRGGTRIEDLKVLLSVRPLQGLERLKSGQVVKRFAKFELEVPLFVTNWVPVNPDRRLIGLAALLEKDPYKAPPLVRTRVMTKELPPNGKSWSNVSPALRSDELSRSSSLQTTGSSRGFASLSGRNLLPPARSSFVARTQFPVRSTTFLMRRSNVSFWYSPKNFRHISTGRFSRASTLFCFAAGLFMLNVAMASSAPSSIPKTLGMTPVKGSISFPVDVFNSHDSSTNGVSSVAPFEFAHGTTTLAFIFRDGIVVAVDSRATLGTFIGSKTTHKVLPIHSHLIGTMAGGAADCSHWIRKLQTEARLYQQMEGGKRMSVSRAARLLSNVLYENRGLGLSLGTMICGFDDDVNIGTGSLGSPRIFYVDDSGMRIEGDLFTVGSGSTYAIAILDTERHNRFGMSAADAVTLGIRAIRHATFRDAHSGGFINVYLITHKDGWQHVFSQDLSLLREEEEI